MRLLEQDRLRVATDAPAELGGPAPRRWSWGRTVTASAPAIPAAKQATVERSAFTHGSYAVIIAAAVTAWIGEVASGAPDASATRAHSSRAARMVAIVANWSAVAARRSSMRAIAAAGVDAPLVEGPQVVDAGGDGGAELLGVGRTGGVEAGAVDRDDAQVGAVAPRREIQLGHGVELGVGASWRRCLPGGLGAERVGTERAGVQVLATASAAAASGPRRRARRRPGRASRPPAPRRPSRRR